MDAQSMLAACRCAVVICVTAILATTAFNFRDTGPIDTGVLDIGGGDLYGSDFRYFRIQGSDIRSVDIACSILAAVICAVAISAICAASVPISAQLIFAFSRFACVICATAMVAKAAYRVSVVMFPARQLLNLCRHCRERFRVQGGRRVASAILARVMAAFAMCAVAMARHLNLEATHRAALSWPLPTELIASFAPVMIPLPNTAGGDHVALRLYPATVPVSWRCYFFVRQS